MFVANSMSPDTIYDARFWRRFFSETKISIGVETALPWIENGSDVSIHIKTLVRSLTFVLATLGARVTPRHSVPGQDFADRTLGEDAFLFSHHSIGTGERIFRFKHSYRHGYFTFDPLGYAGFSQFAQDSQLVSPAWSLDSDQSIAYAAALREEYIAKNFSKYAQRGYDDEPLQPGYLFLALQIPTDTVVKLAPSDPIDFYRKVVQEADKIGKRCVIKRHPRCSDPRVTQFLSEVKDLSFVTISDRSINQLLPDAERVVVINSTVGLEALIHARPTLTFAASEYASVTTSIRNLDDIPAALAGPALFDRERVSKFLLYFFEHFCVRVADEQQLLIKVQQCLSGLPKKYGWTS
jgi:hypothetical protein